MSGGRGWRAGECDEGRQSIRGCCQGRCCKGECHCPGRSRGQRWYAGLAGQRCIGGQGLILWWCGSNVDSGWPGHRDHWGCQHDTHSLYALFDIGGAWIIIQDDVTDDAQPDHRDAPFARFGAVVRHSNGLDRNIQKTNRTGIHQPSGRQCQSQADKAQEQQQEQNGLDPAFLSFIGWIVCRYGHSRMFLDE
jgi:hypothetical protein